MPAGWQLERVGHAGFAEAVGGLRGSPAGQRAAQAERLAASPVPYQGWVLRRTGDTEVLACGQTATEGTLVHSHHTWMIRSFWWFVVWMAVGGILFITLVGIPLAYLVWGVAWLWKAYRLIRGFIALEANEALPV